MKSKAYLILVVFVFTLIPLLAFSQEETLTITTYYPSPYGSYKELSSYRMKIGSTYSTTSMTDADNGKLIVEGPVGIGTTSPASGYKLDVEGKIQATAFTVGDITFRDQETQQILWRMFEDEDGLYLENNKTGKVYRFVLQEVDK